MSTISTGNQPLRFELSRQPVGAAEQRLFGEDAACGLNIWTVLNATLETKTRASVPYIVRAYWGHELVGAALIVRFTRPGRCLFRSPALYKTVDVARVPEFIWNRLGAGIDGYSNPGCVRAGLSQAEFVGTALDFLTSRYLLGCLIDAADKESPRPAATIPHLDYGVIDLRTAPSPDYFLARHGNLGRKLRKFRNRGGTLEVIEGALPQSDREKIWGWLETLTPAVYTPFQDLYPAMACRALGEPAGTVHFISRLQGELVGYQSFVHRGAALSCLSGVFDRSRTTTYHAYEALILESVRYAAAHGLKCLEYGPIVNPTKAKLMTHSVRAELRYYTRSALLRRSLGWVLERSHLSPRYLGAYMGQTPVWDGLEEDSNRL